MLNPEGEGEVVCPSPLGVSMHGRLCIILRGNARSNAGNDALLLRMWQGLAASESQNVSGIPVNWT